jgi:glycyl-tRNA synthetase beta chain
MAEFFVEFFSEEMPARFQKQSEEDVKRLVVGKFEQLGIVFDAVTTFVTPRRLGFVVTGLPVEVPARIEQRKGPKTNAPSAAVAGFLKSLGLADVSQCEQLETPNGSYWLGVTEIPAKKTISVLPGILQDILQTFPWTKSMSWGTGVFRWVRPLRSILALFDGASLPFYLYLGNGNSGKPSSVICEQDYLALPEVERTSCVAIANHTQGHRFLSPGSLEVGSFRDFAEKLLEAKVIIDRSSRKAKIREESDKLLMACGGLALSDDALLEEVCGLTEWPVPVLGKIDLDFMVIPAEVLTATMRNHQKYFPVFSELGELLPVFLATSNTETSGDCRQIVSGYERVLRARFADAKFFWDSDCKVTLESRLPLLSKVVFHAKLGTLGVKALRVEALAPVIAKLIFGSMASSTIIEDSRRAGRLAKADLVSGMVGEFPELQGIMGCYYARNDGESAEVAIAIREHYSPLGPSDVCPKSPISIAVALADKIDSLIGFFAIGEKPTGSKDPFALRRGALGILRIIIENQLHIDLTVCLESAYDLLLSHSQKGGECVLLTRPEVVCSLLSFLLDRLKGMLREQGIPLDLVSSVFDFKRFDGSAAFDVVANITKLHVLEKVLQTEAGVVAISLYNRAANLLIAEERKDKKAYSNADLDSTLLVSPEEIRLFSSLSKVAPKVRDANSLDDVEQVFDLLASLGRDLDDFFDNVAINSSADEFRINRLVLLSRIRDLCNEVANFSSIAPMVSHKNESSRRE